MTTSDGARTPAGRARAPRARRLVAVVVTAIVTVLVALLAPGPALAATPAPPGGDGLIWRADTGGDLLGSFVRNSYNEQDGAPREVPSPSGHGEALEFSLDGGDQRSELLPRVPDGRESDVYYYGYRGQLADDFPVDVQRFQIIMQWHHYGDEGSPPVAIAVQNGQLMITGGDDDRNEAYQQPIAPISPGDPVDLIVRIVFSRDPGTGTVDVWSGGRRTVTAFHPPDGTLYDEGDYMKVGLYRSEDLQDPARLTLDDVAVGRTRQAVDAAMVDQGGTSAEGTPDAEAAEPGGSATPLRVSLAAGTIALIGAVVAVAAVVRRRQVR